MYKWTGNHTYWGTQSITIFKYLWGDMVFFTLCKGIRCHKGQWGGALMLSLICAWTNSWVNNRNTGVFRCHHAHYDVTVMTAMLHVHLGISNLQPHGCFFKSMFGLPSKVTSMLRITGPLWGNSTGNQQGAVSIRKTVLPGMAIPMLKIRRPNGRLIFNMEIAIRR